MLLSAKGAGGGGVGGSGGKSFAVRDFDPSGFVDVIVVVVVGEFKLVWLDFLLLLLLLLLLKINSFALFKLAEVFFLFKLLPLGVFMGILSRSLFV